VTLKGSCLCGAVHYEVDRLDTPIGLCHCATCRKAHAAPYAPTARVMRDHFRLIAGADKLAAFESSPGKMRRFCSVCGTHIVAERAEQPHVVLRVATLDDDPMLRGRSFTSGPRMTCLGSPMEKVCRAFPNGRPGVNIAARKHGCLKTTAGRREPSRWNANPATPFACRRASATDRRDGRWRARGSRACPYDSPSICHGFA
jgi:hypothetical protein